MSANPLISVLVPVYKVEPYLDECVTSVLQQTYPHWELVLVDDGSPDRCGEICDSYADKDPRIKVVHKQNGGLVSARKAGVTVCTGEYVMNLDGDDRFAGDLLRQIADIVVEHNPDVIAFDCIRFSENSEAWHGGFLPAGLYTGDRLTAIADRIIHNQTDKPGILYGIALKAVRREFYIPYQLAVPDAISVGEDLAVTGPLLSHADSIYVSGIAGYYYRSNPSSIMNTFRQNEMDQLRLLIAHLEQAMGPAHIPALDAYILTRYNDFIDRGMFALGSFAAYRALIRETLDEEILQRLRRAICRGGSFSFRLVFWLMKHQHFTLYWLLRHLKKRH